VDLKAALKAVSPAVGDGKVIPEHAYAMLSGGLLQVTDGNQWASVRLGGSGHRDFCVRYDALDRALGRAGSRLALERNGDVKVTYQPRGWAKMKGLSDPSAFPTVPEVVRASNSSTYRLPMNFKKWCADLCAFTGANDAQVWTQGVHIGPDFMFAGTGFGAVRTRESVNTDNFIAMPIWAARFVAAQADPPASMVDYGNLVTLAWEDGLTLHSRLLAEDASESVVELVSNFRIPTTPVPEGLKDAVARLKEHGATTFKAGGGRVVHHSEAVDVEEEVAIDGPVKVWSVDRMQAALEHATCLDLSEEHAYWASDHYVGIVAGMRG
jgi:hypothetical protein